MSILLDEANLLCFNILNAVKNPLAPNIFRRILRYAQNDIAWWVIRLPLFTRPALPDCTPSATNRSKAATYSSPLRLSGCTTSWWGQPHQARPQDGHRGRSAPAPRCTAPSLHPSPGRRLLPEHLSGS